MTYRQLYGQIKSRLGEDAGAYCRYLLDRALPELLIDDNKVTATEFRYGKVTKRTVIYRGPNAMEGEICYVNVEDYLRALDI